MWWILLACMRAPPQQALEEGEGPFWAMMCTGSFVWRRTLATWKFGATVFMLQMVPLPV